AAPAARHLRAPLRPLRGVLVLAAVREPRGIAALGAGRRPQPAPAPPVRAAAAELQLAPGPPPAPGRALDPPASLRRSPAPAPGLPARLPALLAGAAAVHRAAASGPHGPDEGRQPRVKRHVHRGGHAVDAAKARLLLRGEPH